MKTRRHSSAPRKNEDEKKDGKGAPFFAVPSIGLVGWWVRRALGFAGAVSAIDAAGAGAGAVEAVRNAVLLPTLGTEAW